MDVSESDLGVGTLGGGSYGKCNRRSLGCARDDKVGVTANAMAPLGKTELELAVVHIPMSGRQEMVAETLRRVWRSPSHGDKRHTAKRGWRSSRKRLR